MDKEIIEFTDKSDLLNKLVIKKVEANESGALKSLQNALSKVKHGDKHAMQEVIKLRKRMLNAAAEVYMEINEDEQFNGVVAELKIVDLIKIDD